VKTTALDANGKNVENNGGEQQQADDRTKLAKRLGQAKR
jgi:hypothetical protein